ncbi:hypothetical protein [uncultured Fusobacterium sp.]|nr:hypothetical protein [uncultured Fusobacterium sp.]
MLDKIVKAIIKKERNIIIGVVGILVSYTTVIKVDVVELDCKKCPFFTG